MNALAWNTQRIYTVHVCRGWIPLGKVASEEQNAFATKLLEQLNVQVKMLTHNPNMKIAPQMCLSCYIVTPSLSPPPPPFSHMLEVIIYPCPIKYLNRQSPHAYIMSVYAAVREFSLKRSEVKDVKHCKEMEFQLPICHHYSPHLTSAHVGIYARQPWPYGTICSRSSNHSRNKPPAIILSLPASGTHELVSLGACVSWNRNIDPSST